MSAAVASAPRPPTQAERRNLSLLREVFLHRAPAEGGSTAFEFVAAWWFGMRVEERRLLLAFCGLDDSEESAARPWPQLLQEHRDRLLTECKRLARLLSVLRLA
jgi:hypothetical protein